jgi:hypothetical protein
MAVEIMRADIGSIIDRRCPDCLAVLHQVTCQFGLAIDHDALAAGQIRKIDPVVAAVEGEREAVMRQPFSMHPCTGSGLVHQPDGALLKHPRTDPAKNIVLADTIQNDGLDAGFGQQLPKQQPGRT